MSLHQAAHLIERGLGAATAAASVSIFSAFAIVATLAFGMLVRRAGVRPFARAHGMSAGGCGIGHGDGGSSAGLFGLGVGGLQVVLPVAWADYFGRRNFGAIRGVALTVQVTAQALGPLLSGLLRDGSGNYLASFFCFSVLSAVGTLTAPPLRSRASAIAPL